MAGPWEKYQKQPDQEAEGPWTKRQAAPEVSEDRYERAVLWPWKKDRTTGDVSPAIPGILLDAAEFVKAPGQAYRGEMDPLSDEGIDRTIGLAGMISPLSAGSKARMGVSAASATRKKLATAIKRDALTPDTAATRLKELGPDAMLADMGPNLQGQAQALAARPGDAQTIIRDAIMKRHAGANARIRTGIDNTIGPAPVPARVNAGIKEGQKALGPRYDEALQWAAPARTQAIARSLDDQIPLLRGPAQKALQSVRTMLNQHGRDAVTSDPSVLFATRNAIDGMLDGEVNTKVIGVLSATRSQIDDALAAAAPQLKNVDASFEGLARQKEAFGRGRDVMGAGKNTPVPEELADEVLKAVQPVGTQQGPSAAAYRMSQGARAEIERLMGTKINDVPALHQLVKGEGSWNRQRLATLFGEKKADRLIQILEQERKFAASNNRIVHNSETAARQQAMGELFGTGSRSDFGTVNSFKAGGFYGAARSIGTDATQAIIEAMIGIQKGKGHVKLAKDLTTSDRQAIMDAVIRANNGRKPDSKAVRVVVDAMLSRPDLIGRLPTEAKKALSGPR